MKVAIERRIEQVLALEGLRAQALSRVLFAPGGLFNELASSEAERAEVARSALFQRANDRLTALQEAELRQCRVARQQGPAARG